MPWLLLHFLSLVPSATFLAALRGHASPGYIVLIVYFVIHAVFINLLAYLYHEIKFLAICWVIYILQILICILQITFTFTAIWISTCWIASLAPFLDSTSQDLLPDFVWPNTTAPFRKWVPEINETTPYPAWATCNATNVNDTNASHHLVTAASSFEFCLTDIAAHLYIAFVVSTILASIYQAYCIIKNPCEGLYRQDEDEDAEEAGEEEEAGEAGEEEEASVDIPFDDYVERIRMRERI